MDSPVVTLCYLLEKAVCSLQGSDDFIELLHVGALFAVDDPVGIRPGSGLVDVAADENGYRRQEDKCNNQCDYHT